MQIHCDICLFDRMKSESFKQDNTKLFCFYAWMANPDLLPHSRTIIFFPERVGGSNASDGPALAGECIPIVPPDTGEVVVLFH
jgi:hypothetical protein